MDTVSKVFGFGFSYSFKHKKIPVEFYLQSYPVCCTSL